jgi:hypothetical protein
MGRLSPVLVLLSLPGAVVCVLVGEVLDFAWYWIAGGIPEIAPLAINATLIRGIDLAALFISCCYENPCFHDFLP